MPGRCSPTASRLPHAPTGQGDAGSGAPERDSDVVADLTGARWRRRAALEDGRCRGRLDELLRGSGELLDLLTGNEERR
jgi:hypothetical protein